MYNVGSVSLSSFGSDVDRSSAEMRSVSAAVDFALSERKGDFRGEDTGRDLMLLGVRLPWSLVISAEALDASI